ncbi:AAA family ATPase [Brevibacillus nitrificans]|uniref:HTH-type transcriptional regulatory protein TyrR n=1 Tax=Brevibacillus nitrificans TaxID=651560 RepID=A0A3M8D583_9BACL|nr:sigma 54-interacting transcriptional regulator [Brevibacillus nitrificans]RNB83200.1 AAA family ATPase [Brevibacillus nitrificans]
MEKSAIFRDERNKLFLDIMNSIRDALWVLDKHGNVLWVNNAAKRGLFEVSDIDLVNQNVLEMEKRGLFYPSIARLVTESKHFINTVQVTQNNQKLLVSGDFIPDENGDIEYIVSHARTLSETLNTNMELEKAEELLQRYKSQIRQLIWEKNKDNGEESFIGKSKAYVASLEWLEKVADVDTTVLITGETGVGKSAFAAKIHQLSDRSDKPFVHLNCAAIPEALIESELFGYKKGAFTGANQNGKTGLIAAAENGVLFLDEISELPLHLQSKLLQFLQNKTYIPVGGSQVQKADVRIIAATNTNLLELTRTGQFRADLFYRLNILPLNIPPLRERREDIVPLLDFYLKKYNNKYQKDHTLSGNLTDVFYNYDWPGNIRELENLLERLVITVENKEMDLRDLPDKIRNEQLGQISSLHALPANQTLTEYLNQIEREIIEETYRQLQSTRKAAARLGVTQAYIARRFKKYKLKVVEEKDLTTME